MSIGLLLWIMGKYTKPGETILDPMAGIGTSMLATLYGRDVILVELEEKFIKLCRDNWEKLQQVRQVTGSCQIIQADARQLEGLLSNVNTVITSQPYPAQSPAHTKEGEELRLKIAKERGVSPDKVSFLDYTKPDAIITSPPFKEQMQDTNWMQREQPREHRGTHDPKSQDPDNIGNLKYGEIDAVVSNANKCYNLDKCQLGFILELKNTGKPYQGDKKPNEQLDGQTLGDISVLIVGVRLIDEQPDVSRVLNASECLAENYQKIIKQIFVQIIRECLAKNTRNNQDLKCLLTEGMDSHLKRRLTNAITILLNGESGGTRYSREIIIPAKIVEQNAVQDKLFILNHITLNELLTSLNLSLMSPMEKPFAIPATLQQDKPTYLSEMARVYSQCHKVLKPEGGLMILVTKNFIRNKRIVRLDFDTVELCERAGFTLIAWHERKLTSQSFWRTIYHQKYPEVPQIDHEDVLVFSKEQV